MRKVAIVSFLFLSVVISGILFWQWSAFSKQHDKKINHEKDVTQEIIIEASANKLNVKQSFTGLTSDKQYKLHIPKKVEKLTCKSINGQKCQLEDEKQSIIFPEDEVVFSYTLPLNRDKALLLADWSILINEIDVKLTKLEIAETSNRDSTWVAGARFIGNEQLDLIDYFVFEGESDNIPLYWENSKLKKSPINEDITIYYSGQQKHGFELSDDIITKVKSVPASIVVTNNISPANEKGLVVIGQEANNDFLEKQLAFQYFLHFAEEPLTDSIYDLLASLLLNVDPETDKGMILMQTMEDSLSRQEFDLFIQSLLQQNVRIAPESLDDKLAEIKGLETDFFKLNNDNKEPLLLYFYDSKQVIINDKETDLKVVVENNKRQFPFVQTMELFGFEVNNLSNQILLTKKNTMMRFYLNKNIFILNEEDYGLLENPLKEINGEIYIEQKWLKNIFNIVVSEKEEQLHLSNS